MHTAKLDNNIVCNVTETAKAAALDSQSHLGSEIIMDLIKKRTIPCDALQTNMELTTGTQCISDRVCSSAPFSTQACKARKGRQQVHPFYFYGVV